MDTAAGKTTPLTNEQRARLQPDLMSAVEARGYGLDPKYHTLSANGRTTAASDCRQCISLGATMLISQHAQDVRALRWRDSATIALQTCEEALAR